MSAAWRAAYRRSVRSAFATVPFYRERWALDGRTDPVLVPGRTGTDSGAAPLAEAVHKIIDLVPLAGGTRRIEPNRGLGPVLRKARSVTGDALVVVLGDDWTLPPTDLPRGVRCCLVDPEAPVPGVLAELASALRGGRRVVAVGDDKQLAVFADVLPEDRAYRVESVPRRELDTMDSGPYGVLHDPALGYLGAIEECGRWHLDWARVYARTTPGGLAFTLLRQDSPRFVDVLPAGGVRGEIVPCPRHGTPVVLT